MKRVKAENIPLVPFTEFKRAVAKVLSNSKSQSDRQIAEAQAANVKRRAGRKKD
jgi:hypothetical protein